MNKFILFVVIALVAIGGFVWYQGRTQEGTSAPIVAEFTSAETGGSIVVSFDNAKDTATLNGLGHTNLVFDRAVSASGARYVNDAEDLVLWNKGDEITLYGANDEVLFVGVTGTSGEETDPELFRTWVWRETQMNDDTLITPNDADAFTLTFDENNRITGTTDCNGFFGSYSAGVGRTISFGSLASTKMYCEGSQEEAFMRMVTDSDHYMFTEEGELVLLIKFDSGSVLFTKQ